VTTTLSAARLPVVVDRAHWLRGKTGFGSMLLRSDGEVVDGGKMCCLGFVALAIGCSREEIVGVSSPLSKAFLPKVSPHTSRIFPGLGSRHGDAVIAYAVAVNDSDAIQDDERERQLTSLFTQIGVDMTFTGPRADAPRMRR
jgi:hypothetical protein